MNPGCPEIHISSAGSAARGVGRWRQIGSRETLKGKKVLLRLGCWQRQASWPGGTTALCLQLASLLMTNTEVHAHLGTPDCTFTATVLACMPSPWYITRNAYAFTCTVGSRWERARESQGERRGGWRGDREGQRGSIKKSFPRQRRSPHEYVTRNECNVHPALSPSLFLPFRPASPFHDPPPFSSPPCPSGDLYFYRGRAAGRYVAYAHHAPAAFVPPIGPPAAGHFGPCGGCAFISPLCLPLDTVTFGCVGAPGKDAARV